MSKVKRGVYAVILVGGLGRRFWPLSRRNEPKPFLTVASNKACLLKTTLKRASSIAGAGNVLVVANKVHRQIIRERCPEVRPENVISEPVSRNTAPAIALAASVLSKRGEGDAVMVVLPSDHCIPDSNRFRRIINRGVEFAREKGCLLTLGIKPTHPSTGFGYIRRAPRPARPERPRVFKVMKFVEKPELKVAEAFLKSGEYLWNSGIFIWRIDALFRALKALNPPLYSLAAKGCPHHYRRLKDESIDYAIMEKARGIYCVEANLEWHDLGSWASLAQMREGDSKGNVSLGLCETYDADNSISVSEPGHLVSLCGVSGLVVVQTKDATLVCSKKKAEEVKELVNKLEKKRGLKRYL